MGQIQDHTKMNAAEYAVIWSQYINDSLSSCVLQYMLEDADEENIRKVFVSALELSKRHFIKKGYMTGWPGKRRPINAIEISGVFLNMQKTLVKMVLELGFGQVCKSKEIRSYMERARGLCVKHFDILGALLKEENLHIPKIFESEVTDSTVSPFSDKLMLFHITGLLSAAISYHSEAAAISQRRDVVSAYYKAECGNRFDCRGRYAAFN
jgi:Protein of unknown function (DUF3231)